jgi:hypothetical protein
MAKSINKYLNLFFIIAGGIIFCFYALYNNYPLVYSDTGTYIHSGFENIVPTDRPIFYGLFVRHISLHYSLWLVIIAQGVILSYVIFQTIQNFTSKNNKIKLFFFVILFITALTGISVNVSQVIPDVFSPISFLCLIILLFGKSGKSATVLLSIFFLLSLLFHFSNLIVNIILLFIIFFITLYRRYKKREKLISISKVYFAGTLIVIAIVIIPTVNYSFEGKFRMTKGSHVFMMNHLLETGILKDYLNENCASKEYKICNYKDSLKSNFMWDSNSPLYKTGGWEANTDEYNSIIKDVLLKPRYLYRFIMESFRGGFIQFFRFDMGSTPPCKENSPPYCQIEWRFKNSLKQYISAKQFNARLNYSLQNILQKIVIVFSVLLAAYLFYTKKMIKRNKYILLIILIFFIINAFVCSTFSGIDNRFQSRIIWIFPFIIILFINECYSIKDIKRFL